MEAVEGGKMEIGNNEASEYRLQAQLFGAFDARVNGIPIPPLRSRKVQWLLALLLLRHGQALDRAWLAGTLWPESDPAQALYNLRQSLSNLRHALGKAGICLHTPMVNALTLDAANATVDVISFDTAIATGEKADLERAVALYRGPLLEGCAGEWVLGERRVREEQYLSALERLGDMASAAGEGSAAIRYFRRAVQADPFRETTQRALIQSLAATGDYGAAVQAYRDLRLLLRRELNTDPDPETSALFQHIRSKARQQTQIYPTLPDTPSSDLPDSPPSSPLRRLPCALTTLVGRSSEMEQVVTALRATRLLTLTGLGGVGKTRLAIAVAGEMAEHYPEGVCFVDLAPISDPDLIVQTAGAALQVRETSGRSPSAALLEWLKSKTLLLLLDNCEHLLDGCARFADDLLRNCRGVSVLATSRQALGLTGETVRAVPPLATPVLADFAPDASSARKEWLSLLSEYEAVQLFVTRAQQTLPAFQMSAHNARVIAQICVHLDGIPLALELAAARVGSLAVEEINSKLDNRFRLLTRGSRAALPRQQTLRALMDWSYDLLNAGEKALFCRLSVFAGGWTLQAVMEVCAEEGLEGEEAFEAWEGLDLLTSLVDKSLVLATSEAGQTRYDLLETVRQYARDRLAESGTESAWRAAHCRYFLRVAEEAAEKLKGPDQVSWLQRLETEHDNLRAALDFCLYAPEGALSGLQLAGDLQQFWWLHGHWSEGRNRLTAALGRPEAQEVTEERARALIGAGSLTWMQGDYAGARSFYESALTLGRNLGNRRVIAGTLGNMGTVATLQSDYAAARSCFEESLAIKRELGDKRDIANSLSGLGTVAMEQGDYATARLLGEESLALGQELEDQDRIARSLINLGNVALLQSDYLAARSLFEQSLTIKRELGDRRGIANVLSGMGNVAKERENHAEAHSLYEESLALQRELGDRDGASTSLCNLGALLNRQGDYEAAQSCLNECIRICRELDKKRIMAYALEGYAELARGQQQTAKSVCLYGAAHALRKATNSPLSPREDEEHARYMAALRESAGEDMFSASWAQGQAMTLEQAIACALEESSA